MPASEGPAADRSLSQTNDPCVQLDAGTTFPGDGIDLPDIAFGAQTTLAYSENAVGTGCTLTVSDGRHAASIALLGNYIAGSFAAAADGHGGTLVTQAQPQQQPLLIHPQANYFRHAGYVSIRPECALVKAHS
jgi:hypothetical protein